MKTTSLETGAHLNLDFHGFGPLGHDTVVPVALTGEYVLSYDFDSSSARHSAIGGLYYSGRCDVELGGVVGANIGDKDLGLLGQMVINYYF